MKQNLWGIQYYDREGHGMVWLGDCDRDGWPTLTFDTKTAADRYIAVNQYETRPVWRWPDPNRVQAVRSDFQAVLLGEG